MIIKTRGIVFRFTRYRESSIIANIYTEEAGLGSYIVNGVRSAKGKAKMGYFEPLTLLELTAYHNPDRDINRLNELRLAQPLHHIRSDVHKSSIIMFLTEILNKCILERDKNEPLFNFLYNSIQALDLIEHSANFHLQFLVQLSSYLGFGIQDSRDFINQSSNQVFYRTAENKQALKLLIEQSYNSDIRLTKDQRSAILNDLIFYYQQHIGLNKLKSLEVLNTIFS